VGGRRAINTGAGRPLKKKPLGVGPSHSLTGARSLADFAGHRARQRIFWEFSVWIGTGRRTRWMQRPA